MNLFIFEARQHVFQSIKEKFKIVFLKSSQPNGLELSEVGKIFISRFPQLLRVQRRRLRYLNASTVFEECF